MDPVDAPSHTDEELGVHAGAGADFPLGPGWVMNADLRYYALADKIEGRRVRDLDADGWQLRAGLTYYFP